MANYHYVHNLWQSVRGTPNNCMFWLFPENGSISERTVNRALIVHTTLQILHLKKYILIFIFAMYQNYPLALILTAFFPSFQINPHWISNSGLRKVVLETFQNGLKNRLRESCYTRTMLLHTRNQSSVTQIVQSLQWQTLQERRTHNKVIMLYRIVNPTGPPFLYPSLDLYATRGHNQQFRRQHCRTLTYKHSFFSECCLHVECPTCNSGCSRFIPEPPDTSHPSLSHQIRILFTRTVV